VYSGIRIYVRTTRTHASIRARGNYRRVRSKSAYRVNHRAHARACMRAPLTCHDRLRLVHERAPRPGLLIVLHGFSRRVPAAMPLLHDNIAACICIVTAGKKPALVTRYYCHYRMRYCRRH